MVEPVVRLKALADPGRLLLARLLVEGTFNVSEVCEILDAPQSTTSRNLKILVDAGLAAGRREGRLIFYAWRSDLDAGAQDLRRWVAAHGPELGGELRRRIHGLWEERRERTAAFFSTVDATDPGAAWLGSADCLPAILQRLPRDGAVLDLGTGTGRLLPDLASSTRGAVIGVDASPSMLGQARARLDAAGIDGVDLRLGDLAHLPLIDGEVDAVVANMVLHHLPEPGRVFDEIRRVLKPGGTFLIGDFLPHDQEWMRESLADQWLGIAPEDVRSWLGSAGFDAVDVEPLPPNRPGALGVFVVQATRPRMHGA